MAAYLYTENGLLLSTRATWIQWEFDVQTKIFDWVGIPTNMFKTVIMVYQPCCTIGGHSAEAYDPRMIGEGLTYRNRLCQRVRCPECNADLAAGSLETHRQIQHRVGQGYLRSNPHHPLYVTRMYLFCFPWTSRDITLPVGGAHGGPQVGAPSCSTLCTAACGTCECSWSRVTIPS